MVSNTIRQGTRKRVIARLLATAMVGAGIAVAPIVAPDVAPSAAAATGGPVVLDGMDPVCHATVGEGTDGYIKAVLAGLHTNATRTNDGSIAVLGVDAARSSCGATFGTWMPNFTSAITPTPTVRYFPDDAAITGLFDAIEAGTAKPAVVWLPDGAHAAEGVVTARSQDLADFVGQGGGLFANHGGYGWLTALLPNAQFVNGGCNGGPAVTAAGKESFPSLTDQLVTACWHGFFTGDIGALQALVDWPYPDAGGPRVGVAIGGAQVTLSAVPVSTAPGAPGITATAVSGGEVAVTVAPPASDGGAAITSYTVTAQPGGETATVDGAAGGTATISGLTNGTEYTFTATATNAAGTSAAGPEAKATPVTRPGGPAITKISVGNGKVTVTVAPPADNGGAVVTSYTVTAQPGGRTATVRGAAGGSATISGLTNGVAYTFTATATNGAGTSTVSTNVTSTPVTVPGAPSWKLTRTDLGGIGVVVTAPGSTGGSTLRRLVVTVTGGGVKQTVVVSPRGGTANITGLEPATAYTVSVVAETAAGTSTALTRTVKTAPLPKGPVPMTELGPLLYPGMSATLIDEGLFGYLSAKLSSQGREQALRTARSLSGAQAIRCEGHTDGADNKANYGLGLARAKAVCAYLASHGVKAKVTTVSYGAGRPVRTTGSRDQRAVNRRVVVTVTK
jgi:outer membrane protein OmpA-like peptidoglycan-associated protein